MTRLGGFGIAGVGSQLTTVEKELFWGGDQSKLIAVHKNGILDGGTRDSGNSPTTLLRAGLVLGKITATGKYSDYDPDAQDGTEIASAILPISVRAQDFDANDADRSIPLIVGGQLKAGELIGLDRQARNQFGANMIFDDELPSKQNFLGAALVNEEVTGDKTAVLTDHGKRFVCTTADCDFTLPAIATAIGFKCEILRASDHELAVISAEGDNIIAGNDLSADSVTWTTAGEQIGARCQIECIVVGTTPKWLLTVLDSVFSTDDYLAKTIAT